MNKVKLPLICILFVATILRFYNLMHDSPYFFNPDERNMANAVTQFRLPKNPIEIYTCIKQEITVKKQSQAENTGPNCNLNPHFFSYSQFPLYLAFVSDQTTTVMLNLFQHLISYPEGIPKLGRDDTLSTTFLSAVFWLRIWSALTSTFTVLLVFFISRQLLTLHVALLTALLSAFTPGLIQAAHFGTTESLLTFLFLVSIYFSLKLYGSYEGSTFQKKVEPFKKIKYALFLALSIGLALGSKLTGLFFLIPPAIAILLQTIRILVIRKKKFFLYLLGYWFIGLLVFIGSITIGILTSPYNLIQPENFKSAVFGYEADVATGKYEAFYTRQFVNTVPFVFQAQKIFPYGLGWPVFTLGSAGLLLMIVRFISPLILFITASYQKSKIKNQKYILKIKNILPHWNIVTLCIVSFLVYLIPNVFLFAKWTRFMTPLFPFFSIFSAFALFKFLSILNHLRSQLPITNYQLPIKSKNQNSNRLKNWNLVIGYCLDLGIWLLVIISILPGLAFMSIYMNEDSRLTASKWIYEHIPNHSYILFETANVIDIPLGISNYAPSIGYDQITVSFDFYHLDQQQDLYESLLSHLEKAGYIYIPSRRLFKNHTLLPKKYPILTRYYDLLFTGKLGFEKVTEISSFPRIGPLIFPDEEAEETYTVFDHPVIRIYKKVKPMTKDQYNILFRTN